MKKKQCNLRSVIIKYASYKIHISEALLRMLRILAFGRRIFHPSIQYRSLQLIFHFTLVIDLSMKERCLAFTIIDHGICIHAVKVILRVSKLTRIIYKAVTETTKPDKSLIKAIQHKP